LEAPIVTRFFSVLAVSLTLSSAALAEEQMVVVPSQDAQETHAKIVAAAKTVCARALSHDYFGDYGPIDQCVSDSVHNAEARSVVRVQQDAVLANR